MVPCETLRGWMKEAGIWLPRAARRLPVQQPRARRLYFGELIQIDGAATMLGLTDRQMRRLVQRYRAHGPEGLISKKRGMRGNHRRPEDFRDHILAIVRERYADFGPTLAREKLVDRNITGLKIAAHIARRSRTLTMPPTDSSFCDSSRAS